MVKTRFDIPSPDTLYWREEGRMMLTMGDMLNEVEEVELIPRDAGDLDLLLWCYDACEVGRAE